MPRRIFQGSYRFGFNGKENDNEVKGQGNWQDYGMRLYSPELARFPTVDPLTKKYPELSTYQFASNTPIQAIDVDGKEAGHPDGPCNNCDGGPGGGAAKGTISNGPSQGNVGVRSASSTGYNSPSSGSNSYTLRSTGTANTPGQIQQNPSSGSQTQLNVNKAAGAQWESQGAESIRTSPETKWSVRNATIRPEGTTKAQNTKADVIQGKTNNTNVNNEYKVGNSRLSRGQSGAQQHSEQGNGRFEVRTDKLESYGYPKGSIIIIQQFNIIRGGNQVPNNLD